MRQPATAAPKPLKAFRPSLTLAQEITTGGAAQTPAYDPGFTAKQALQRVRQQSYREMEAAVEPRLQRGQTAYVFQERGGIGPKGKKIFIPPKG
jgi:hypothetical protein